MAVVGLANVLSIEGRKRNVYVNTIAPVAGSRLTATVLPSNMLQSLRPEYVAPVVGYLCSESCNETGSLFELGAGWIGRLRWERSHGKFFRVSQPRQAEPRDDEEAVGADEQLQPDPEREESIRKQFTPEHVRDNWEEIVDFSADSSHPSSNQEAFAVIMEHLRKQEEEQQQQQQQRGGSRSGARNGSSTWASDSIFEQISNAMESDGGKLVNEVKSVIQFDVCKGDNTKKWLVDLSSGKGSVKELSQSDKASPKLIIRVNDEDLIAMSKGSLNPQQVSLLTYENSEN